MKRHRIQIGHKTQPNAGNNFRGGNVYTIDWGKFSGDWYFKDATHFIVRSSDEKLKGWLLCCKEKLRWTGRHPIIVTGQQDHIAAHFLPYQWRVYHLGCNDELATDESSDPEKRCIVEHTGTRGAHKLHEVQMTITRKDSKPAVKRNDASDSTQDDDYQENTEHDLLDQALVYLCLLVICISLWYAFQPDDEY